MTNAKWNEISKKWDEAMIKFRHRYDTTGDTTDAQFTGAGTSWTPYKIDWTWYPDGQWPSYINYQCPRCWWSYHKCQCKNKKNEEILEKLSKLLDKILELLDE